MIGQFNSLFCIDPTAQRLADALGDARCTAIFDSVGSTETMREAMSLLAEAGTYVNLAVHDTPVQINALDLGSERVMTTSSNALYQDEREAHALIESGTVDVGSMITHRFPLEQFQRAFDLLLRDPREAYKVVFVMGD
jgi:threonine dehydrogenase-like Zn-dependent dehydrogenase